MSELSAGTIQPHELRKFLVKKFFKPNYVDPFAYFNDNKEKAIQHILGVLNKLDKNILAEPQHIIDAFCLNSKFPAKSVYIQDTIILPLGFTPQSICSLSTNNQQVVIDFLHGKSNEDSNCIDIAPSLDDILGAIGIKNRKYKAYLNGKPLF